MSQFDNMSSNVPIKAHNKHQDTKKTKIENPLMSRDSEGYLKGADSKVASKAKAEVEKSISKRKRQNDADESLSNLPIMMDNGTQVSTILVRTQNNVLELSNKCELADILFNKDELSRYDDVLSYLKERRSKGIYREQRYFPSNDNNNNFRQPIQYINKLVDLSNEESDKQEFDCNQLKENKLHFYSDINLQPSQIKDPAFWKELLWETPKMTSDNNKRYASADGYRVFRILCDQYDNIFYSQTQEALERNENQLADFLTENHIAENLKDPIDRYDLERRSLDNTSRLINMIGVSKCWMEEILEEHNNVFNNQILTEINLRGMRSYYDKQKGRDDDEENSFHSELSENRDMFGYDYPDPTGTWESLTGKLLTPVDSFTNPQEDTDSLEDPPYVRSTIFLNRETRLEYRLQRAYTFQKMMIAKDKDFMLLWYCFTLRLKQKFPYFADLISLTPDPSSSNSEKKWPVATFEILLGAIENYNSEIESLKAQLEKEIETSITAMNQLDDEYKGAIAEHKDLKLRIVAQDLTIDQQNIVIKDLKKKMFDSIVEKIDFNYNTSQNYLDKLNEGIKLIISNRRQLIDELSSDNDRILNDNDELSSENYKIWYENDLLSSDNNNLLGENNKLSSDNNNLLSENSKLSSDNKKLWDDNKKILIANKELLDNNLILAAKVEKLEKELFEKDNQLQSIKKYNKNQTEKYNNIPNIDVLCNICGNESSKYSCENNSCIYYEPHPYANHTRSQLFVNSAAGKAYKKETGKTCLDQLHKWKTNWKFRTWDPNGRKDCYNPNESQQFS